MGSPGWQLCRPGLIMCKGAHFFKDFLISKKSLTFPQIFSYNNSNDKNGQVLRRTKPGTRELCGSRTTQIQPAFRPVRGHGSEGWLCHTQTEK